MKHWQKQPAEITEWIASHEEEMLEDLALLVRIPSIAKPGGAGAESAPFGAECRRVLEQMQKIGEKYGFETDDVDGYCLSLSMGEGDLEIGIWNHLDVVPAGDGWLWPPYQCTVKDGYLIGRGVQDNKGPAIAVLYAMRYCLEHGVFRNIRVRQILGCEEECGMQDASYYLEKREAPDYSFVADCGFPVCCGEKGSCRIVLETAESISGICMLQGGTVCNSVPAFAEAELMGEGGKCVTVTAEGISGHAAFPDGTVNAVRVLCEKLKDYPLPELTVRALEFLENLSAGGYGEGIGIDCADAVSGRLTCNVGLVRLEQGRIRAELDIRYPVTFCTGDFLPKLAAEAEQAGFQVKAVTDSAPYYMEETHPFVQLLMSVWRTETGLTGEPFVMGGGTYARKIPNTVAFGPGQDRAWSVLGLPVGHGDCHCADEAEKIDNLKNAICIYVTALMELDKHAGELKDLSGGRE